MEDLKATIVATAVGVLAATGLWLARPSNSRSTIRVVAQWAPRPGDTIDADAAVAFRLGFGRALREAIAEERGVTFRLVDALGPSYPLLPMDDGMGGQAFKLLRGYAHGLRNARLVAISEGHTIASVRVLPIADPVRTALPSSPHPPLRMVARPGGSLRVETARPIPPDERWRIEARRTPYTATDASLTLDSLGLQDPRRFSIPYSDEAGVVEIDLTRYRMVPRSDVVRIPGLRLLSRFGATALRVDRAIRVPNRLGLSILLPRQDNGPRRPHRRGDPRSVTAYLAFGPTVSRASERARWSGRYVKLEILSPSPEETGLRELRVGPGVRRSLASTVGPLRTGSFSVTARITVFDPVVIEKVRSVVPIRVAEPTEPPLGRAASRFEG